MVVPTFLKLISEMQLISIQPESFRSRSILNSEIILLHVLDLMKCVIGNRDSDVRLGGCGYSQRVQVGYTHILWLFPSLYGRYFVLVFFLLDARQGALS
jgi:hypothetical protein